MKKNVLTASARVLLSVGLVVSLLLGGCAGRAPRPADLPSTNRQSTAPSPKGQHPENQPGVLVPAADPTALVITGTESGKLEFADSANQPAQSVDFVDQEHGWAIVGGTSVDQPPDHMADNRPMPAHILATTDGGNTWRDAYAPKDPVAHLQFLNAQEGFATGEDVILATTDGGITWGQQYHDSAHPLRSITFRSATLGWAVRGQALARSADGGQTWAEALATPACAFDSLSFVGAWGWAVGVGPSGPCLYSTVDGGRTWTAAFQNLVHGPAGNAFATYLQGFPHANFDLAETSRGCRPMGMQLTGSRSGWLSLVCSFGPVAEVVLRTDDGGASWSYAWGTMGCAMGCQSMGGSEVPLLFGPGATAWRTAPGAIVRTTDGGRSWTSGGQLCATLRCGPQLSFVDVDHGWAATPDGLFRTEDGGRTWQRRWPDAGPGRLKAVTFTSPEQGWAVAATNWRTLLTTADGGRTWAPVARFDVPIEGVRFRNARTGWAWSIDPAHRLWSTSDGGKTWQSMRQPQDDYGVGVQVKDIMFADPTHGWLLEASGGLWRTIDGAHTWAHLPWQNAAGFDHVQFVDTTHGYATAYNGAGGGWHWTLLATADGGQSWKVVTRYEGKLDQIFNNGMLAFSSITEGWFFGPSGLLHTSDGGKTWTDIRLDAVVPVQMEFVSPQQGWLLTFGGRLLHSRDGGLTWVQVTSD